MSAVKLNFLLESDAGKDTEGRLDGRNDQRPGGDTSKEERGGRAKREGDVYCVLRLEYYFEEFPDTRFSREFPSRLLLFFGNNNLWSNDPLRNLSEKNNNSQ